MTMYTDHHGQVLLFGSLLICIPAVLREILSAPSSLAWNLSDNNRCDMI